MFADIGKAHVVVFLYRVGDMESFNAISQEVKDLVDQFVRPDPIFYLVGLKIGERKVISNEKG